VKTKYCILIAGIIICLLKTGIAPAQLVCDTSFIKEYSGNGNLEPFATKYLPGNEVLIAGKASVSIGGSYQLMAIKLSSTGSVIWSNIIGGGNEDNFKGIVLLNDNSYLLYGTTFSFGHINGKVLLVRMGSSGNVIWSRQLGDGSASKDIIKDIRQSEDGDIVGTFNRDDSTAQSDPVVFKMGIDGTLRWARRFDNSGNDSYTSIASAGNRVYVSGFFTDFRKRAVLTVLNSSNGTVISGQKPFYFDTSYNQELASMEVYNGKISYALWSKKIVGTNSLSNAILLQADLAGVKTYETKVFIDGNPSAEIFKRSRDSGFYLLGNNSSAPAIIKFAGFNKLEWSTVLSNQQYYFNQKNHDFDITNTSGVISAGYYKNFTTNNINRIVLAKLGETGLVGSCSLRGNGYFTDTVTLYQAPFTWATSLSYTPGVNQSVSLGSIPFSVIKTDLCDSTYCVDYTPLPPECNKTFLVEYDSRYSTILRDAVTMPDGGKIAVGEHFLNGFLTRTGNNGDIKWARIYDKFDHTHIFTRVIKSGNDNVFAFANNNYVIDHNAYRIVKVVKLDTNGTILLAKDIIRSYNVELGDVFSTPDGGFVAVLNESWGSGYLYSDVIRFDNNLNVVWKKEIKHFTATPVYRSLFCTPDAVYIGHDTYDSYNQNKIGIQKLDFTTGNDVWSKAFTIDSVMLRFNEIIVENDTVYIFMRKQKEISFNSYDYRIVMMRLTTGGNLISAQTLSGDNLVWPDSWYYFDHASPSVTITPDNNFVMSNQVRTTSGNALNITRFSKEGTGIWSKNYTQLNNHKVYNIYSQDSGVYILGTAEKSTPLNPGFRKNFILKTNNLGEIASSVSATCSTETRPFSSVPVSVNVADPRIDSVVNLIPFSVENSSITMMPVVYDATLYCNETVLCTSIELAGDSSGCNLQDTLVYYITGNNCGALIRWSYDTSFFNFVAQANDTIKLLPLHPGISFVTAEIESACSLSVKQFPVSVLMSASQISLGQDTVICTGDSILLSAGTGFSSYTWSDLSTDSVLWINSPGIYFVTVTDFCGGTFADSIFIGNISDIFSITGNSEKCNTDTLILTASSGFFQYQWSPGASLTFNNNIANVFPLQTTRYHVQAVNSSGCILTDSFLVTVKTSPPVQLGNDTSICYNQTLLLSASPGFNNYIWNNGSQQISTQVSNAGVYSVAATFSNGCISKDTLVVQKYQFTFPHLGPDTSICAGTSLRLSPGNYQFYLWNDLSTQNNISATNVGLYWVDVIDVNGCSAADTMEVKSIFPVPVGFLKPTDSICQYGTLNIEPLKSFNAYTWSTGSNQYRILVDKPGQYTLTVRDSNNCVGKDTIQVSPKICFTGVMIPTGFTPNNDQLNDIFRAKVYGIVESFNLQVYDRWGNLVFSTNDPKNGWDGKTKGIPANTGVFIWQCRYKLLGEKQGFQKGTLTLIR
jgi:gliding motility-associated-like protein